MSGAWRYVINDEVAEFIIDRRASERRQLFKIIRHLANDPYATPEFRLLDISGREISFVTRDGFQIGFWLDHFVKEVRVVDLDQPGS